MLNGLKRSIAARFVGNFLASLATSKDTQTTVAGALAGAVLAIKGLNLSALIAGDPRQYALFISGIAVGGIGWLATKANQDGSTTLLGVIGAAMQASMGDFTAALTVGLTGYFTNKGVDPMPTKASTAGRSAQG
jgi:hypothetical protein